jgi:hypothetical protein
MCREFFTAELLQHRAHPAAPGDWTAAEAPAMLAEAEHRLEDDTLPPPLKFQCPCCGCYTLDEWGKNVICPVCFWQDDEPREQFDQPAPERVEGPNHVHLWEARLNYTAIGASEERRNDFVRAPAPEVGASCTILLLDRDSRADSVKIPLQSTRHYTFYRNIWTLSRSLPKIPYFIRVSHTLFR